MTKTTIRVTTRNNSDARRFVVIDGVRSAEWRHNGGKTVIVTVATGDLDEVLRLLDDSHAVTAYEVR